MTEVNSSLNAVNVLVSYDRSELGKAFGVGFYISPDDDINQVIAKCETCIARYEGYIGQLSTIINSRNILESEMRKARAMRYIKSLSPEEREAVKSLLVS